ncbi:hypothetical protein [Methanothrix soehngenii]|uniref:hypothetical protein n=1 Tax=Methanothrix soehngenii TaxID=2223 RepID=UPI00300D3AA5
MNVMELSTPRKGDDGRHPKEGMMKLAIDGRFSCIKESTDFYNRYLTIFLPIH